MASFPQLAFPLFVDCQPRCAKSIVHGSLQYDPQQIVQATVFWRSFVFVAICWTPLPQDAIYIILSSPLICSQAYKSAQHYTWKNYSQITRVFQLRVSSLAFTEAFSIKRACVGVLPVEPFVHKSFSELHFSFPVKNDKGQPFAMDCSKIMHE